MPNKGVTHPAKVSCSEERPVALRVWQVEREASRPAAQSLPTHHSRGTINPELPWGENDEGLVAACASSVQAERMNGEMREGPGWRNWGLEA